MKVVNGVLAGLWGGGAALFNTLSLLVVTPVVSFYLLRDWDRMIAHINDYLPLDHAETVREQAREVDRVLAGFVRGQMLVCLILASFRSEEHTSALPSLMRNSYAVFWLQK